MMVTIPLAAASARPTYPLIIDSFAGGAPVKMAEETIHQATHRLTTPRKQEESLR